MSRVIKFRAWNGDRMLFRGVYDRNWYSTPANDENGCHCFGGVHPNDQNTMKLMQFTGLLDCNGKDIYEGDVLRPTKHPRSVFNYLSVFNSGVITYGGAAFSIKANGDSYVFHGISCQYLEIIGNIHENKELLK